MAKKNNSEGSNSSLFDILQKVDKNVEILESAAYSNISDWIGTGSYILNACISGDLFKGIPDSRISVLSGTSGCGKSYLACSVCREAQKKGYSVIYLDSENAMDKDFAKRLGCDTNNFFIKQVNTISETSQFITNFCKALDENNSDDKIIIVLDSLGNLTSDKEKDDILAGANKVDFTKAKDVKAMFRTCTIPIAKHHIPWIVVNHVYQNIGSFIGGTVQASGSGVIYNASTIINLTAAKLEDKENDKNASKQVGEQAKKNGVLVSATPEKSRFSIPRKVKFQIPFFKKPNPYVGLEQYLTWENSGIMQGKCINQKEFDKLKPGEQSECKEFEFNGEKLYAWPKSQMRAGVGIVCKHLGAQVTPQEFFSEKVFNQEFLTEINENIIKPLFQLPDQNSFDDAKDLEELLDVSGES